VTLILNNDEVQRVLTTDGCLEILEDAYRKQAEGRAMNQLRYDTEMPLPEMLNDGRYEFKTMVGILPKYGISALRMSSSIVHHPVIAGQYGELEASAWCDEHFDRYPLLEEVVARKVAGRKKPDEITYFWNNAGLGLQFAAVGYVIYKGAKEEGVGREIPTEWLMRSFLGVRNRCALLYERT
jgi:ornithine cyclodeaminase/alanine dehydrogenase-like protein (mu-crystallin family)